MEGTASSSTGEPFDAFLIYNEQETDVDPLAEALRRRGLKIYFFRTDVSPGQSFQDIEDAALANARCVIIVLGPSGWGPSQLPLASKAIEMGKVSFPVIVGQVPDGALDEINGHLRYHLYIDLSTNFDSGISRLARAVSETRARQATSDFEGLIRVFIDGNDNQRAGALNDIIQSATIDRPRLAQRLIHLIENDYRPVIEESLSSTPRSANAITSIRSWMLSALIWSDPDDARSRSVLLHYMTPSFEAARDIRFWCLAGLVQRRAALLDEAAQLCLSDPKPEISSLAGVVLPNTRDKTLKMLETDLGSGDFERVWHVLRILRVVALPELAPTLAQLFGRFRGWSLAYDALYAYANPTMGQACLPMLLETPGPVAVTLEVLEEARTANSVARVAFVRVLQLLDQDLVEETLKAQSGVMGPTANVMLALLAEAQGELQANLPVIAGYASDTIDIANDDLGIAEDVQTLAAVMLARDVEPPLAIGLFGAWGTGKSFFLQTLQASAERIRAEGDPKTFCNKVAQITFNAWHYSDTNLWASLVSHILEQLSAFVTPVPSLDDQQTRLAEQLESSKSAVAEAKLVKQRASAAVDAAKAELVQLRANRANLEFKLSDIKAADLSAIFESDPDVKAAVQDALKSIGAPETLGAIREFNDIVNESRTLGGKIATFTVGLLTGPSRSTVIVCVAAFLMTPIIGWALSYLIGANFALLSSITAEIAVIFGSAASFGKSALAHTRKAFEKVSSAKQKVDQLLAAKRDSAVGDREKTVQEDLSKAQVAEATAEKRLLSVTGKAVELEGRLADLEERRTLRFFLNDRLNSDDYSRHLGVISMIRKDFEGLVEQLQARRDRPVERIVLYIDDLDRCSHETVIEVLKAVHLILAYPLFVVVVSVDPRWLERSLQTTYFSGSPVPANLATEADQKLAKPQDYLEKIFQIPFGIRPMSEEGFSRLMTRLLPVNSDDGRKDDITVQSDDSLPNAPAPAVPTELTGDVARVDEGAYRSFGPGNTGSAPGEVRKAEALARALKITAVEQKFASELFSFIPSPRAAKRFSNLYRILKTPVRSADRAAFEGSLTVPGAFQVPMLLLAISVASPSRSDIDFAALSSALDSNHDDVWATAALTPEVRQLIEEVISKPDFPRAAALVRYWLPRVARFTFSTQGLRSRGNM